MRVLATHRTALLTAALTLTGLRVRPSTKRQSRCPISNVSPPRMESASLHQSEDNCLINRILARTARVQ